jgi:hypothetical protein
MSLNFLMLSASRGFWSRTALRSSARTRSTVTSMERASASSSQCRPSPSLPCAHQYPSGSPTRISITASVSPFSFRQKSSADRMFAPSAASRAKQYAWRVSGEVPAYVRALPASTGRTKPVM